MAGGVSCLWAPWFRAHYKDWSRPPDEMDWTIWEIAHSRLLNTLRGERRDTGEIVLQEGQGEFRLERPSGLVISGRPDLIGIDGDTVTVYDAKTGQRRTSDRVQVMIYMHCLRLTNRAFRDSTIRGEVRYDDGEPPVRIPPEAVRGEFEDHFDYFMRLLESDEPPDRVPSSRECRFCNIAPPDCNDRIEWDEASEVS